MRLTDVTLYRVAMVLRSPLRTAYGASRERDVLLVRARTDTGVVGWGECSAGVAPRAETEYVAYVSEQNLLPDTSGDPVRHPQVAQTFQRDDRGDYRPRGQVLH